MEVNLWLELSLRYRGISDGLLVRPGGGGGVGTSLSCVCSSAR